MNKRILIADDDSGIVEAVKLMLEDEGYSVDTVSSSAEIKNMGQELLTFRLSQTKGPPTLRRAA
jgi:DNA-binding response OmpR family regulator